jgi:hypothetical protein
MSVAPDACAQARGAAPAAVCAEADAVQERQFWKKTL